MTPPAAAAAPAVRPTRRTAPAGKPTRAQPRPRRVSGPARPAKRTGAPRAGRSIQTETGLAIGTLTALRSLSGHRLLDRLIGGRAWIALLAFALIGIVTLQLGLLELNSGIGRALQRTALLQRENASLSIEDSELAAGDRVESQAARLGMELVPTGALRFLSVRPGIDALRAAAALSAPTKASSAATSSGEAGVGAGPSGAATETEPASGAQATTQPATQSAAPAGGESGSSTGEGATPSAATTQSAGAAQSAVAAPAAVAPTPAPNPQPESPAPAAGSAEASPAGGTQAGPSG